MTPDGQTPPALDRRLSVAPMMDRTDRHDRYFLRLISPNALLYSEMVTTGAILHGDRERFLRFDPREHPVALQLGGADPEALATCAALGADRGYDEINLNIGCPSDRVQNARFGACLMAEPALVADCVAAMREAVSVPVTVKTRIGIDDSEEYDYLAGFVETVSRAGCGTFVIHARKAWLSGLSPKENREVPPLRYDVVYRLKQDFPDLAIVINGGITTADEVVAHLTHVDGVMIGRAAYEAPWLLTELERRVFGIAPPLSQRHDAVEAFLPYLQREMACDVPLKSMTRHILGLFQGRPGARAWRRHLSEQAHLPEAGIHTVREAAAKVGREGD